MSINTEQIYYVMRISNDGEEFCGAFDSSEKCREAISHKCVEMREEAMARLSRLGIHHASPSYDYYKDYYILPVEINKWV